MTRKDLILVAVVINAGLLAFLFITAILEEEPEYLAASRSIQENTDLNVAHAAVEPASATPSQVVVVQPLSEVHYTDIPEVSVAKEPEPLRATAEVVHEEVAPASPASQEVRVVVKKGDVLEKIAKAHGTSVRAIKERNDLKNERLSVGQTLFIPASNKKGVDHQKGCDKGQAPSQEEVVYYTVKSGDNPWKIAKQFNVKFEDLLRLNQLDEGKARNLKVGDRIRVK